MSPTGLLGRMLRRVDLLLHRATTGSSRATLSPWKHSMHRVSVLPSIRRFFVSFPSHQQGSNVQERVGRMVWRCSFCSSLLPFRLRDVSRPFCTFHSTASTRAPSSSRRNTCDARRGRRHSQKREQRPTSAGMAGSNRTVLGFERKAKFQSKGTKPRFNGHRPNGTGGHVGVADANGREGTS